MAGFEGHALVIGMSGSGKTSLLKIALIPSYRAKGHKIAVLNPLPDPFEADFQTKDGNEFIRFSYTHTGYVLIVDESGRAVGRYNKLMQSLATDVRHKGNMSVFAAQGVTQLANVVRDQCAYAFIFRASQRNFEIIADEFTHPELLKLPPLTKGEFYFVPKFGEIQKGKIDFIGRKVVYSSV